MKSFRHYALLSLAFALNIGLFLYHFFSHGGQTSVSPDGLRYLAMARGEVVDLPFNTRVFGPFVVSWLAYLTGISVPTAFQIVTASSLFISLILLTYLLQKNSGSIFYQFSILIAFGAELALFYGLLPVLVDGILLLLTCLMLLALQNGKLWLSFTIICFAALTKEYGVLLSLPWAIYAYRKGVKRGYIFASVLLPIVLVLVAVLFSPVQPGVYQGYQDFVTRQLKYQAFWLYLDNLYNYLKLAYFQAWGAIWPVLGLSTLAIFKKYLDRIPMTTAELFYSGMLLSVPVLLTADWNRTFMLLVPFASVAACPDPSTQRVRFLFPLAVGGFATALARSYYFVTFSGGSFPRFYKPFILTLSIGSSVWLIIFFGWEAFRSCKRKVRPNESEC